VKIIEKLTIDLEENGFTNQQAEEIVSQLTTQYAHCMHNRWHDCVENYPTTLYLGLWCRAKKIALVLIAGTENYPGVQLNLLRYKPLNSSFN